MSSFDDGMLKKFEAIAEQIAVERPELHLLALLRVAKLPLAWDFLVSADGLQPYSYDSVDYLTSILRKALRPREFTEIAQVVALPETDRLVRWVATADQAQLTSVSAFDDRFDEAICVWPRQREPLHRRRVALGQ